MSEGLKPQNQRLQKVQKFWDERSVDWRENAPTHAFFNEFCAEHQPELGKEVLDIGCGRGRYLIPLAKQGFSLTGIDISRGMLQKAAEKLREQGLETDVKLVQGQSSSLPFPTENFDFVISIGAIHYNNWPGIQKSVAEAARVLRPGKYFLLQVRSESETFRKRKKIPGRGMAADTEGRTKGIPMHYFTKDEFVELGNENNLEIVKGPTEAPPTDDGSSKEGQIRWWVVYKKR